MLKARRKNVLASCRTRKHARHQISTKQMFETSKRQMFESGMPLLPCAKRTRAGSREMSQGCHVDHLAPGPRGSVRTCWPRVCGLHSRLLSWAARARVRSGIMIIMIIITIIIIVVVIMIIITSMSISIAITTITTYMCVYIYIYAHT